MLCLALPVLHLKGQEYLIGTGTCFFNFFFLFLFLKDRSEMGLEPELPLFHGSGSSQKEQLRLHNTGERYQEEVRVQTLDGGGGGMGICHNS